MIIDIAKSFGFQVMAEGVETQEQLEFIRENEVEFYQGYFFSKAIPQEDFVKLLQS